MLEARLIEKLGDQERDGLVAAQLEEGGQSHNQVMN